MSIFRSTIWLTVSEIVFTLSGYVIAALLGRILGPAEYGRYTLVIGFTTMIVILLGRGIPTAMAKYISEVGNDQTAIRAIKKVAARWQYASVTAAGLIFFFLSPLLAKIFADPSLTPLFQLSSLLIPAFALSSFHVLYFNGLKLFGAMTVLKMARGLFRLFWIVGLASVFHTAGAVIGAVLAPLSVFVLALILDHLHQKRQGFFPSEQTKTVKKFPARKLLRYAGGFMIFLALYEFFMRLDIYLIKMIVGSDKAAGLYAAAATAALIPYYLFYALALVMFPLTSALTTNGNRRAGEMIGQVVRLLLIALVGVGVLLAHFSRPLIELFFGAQFLNAAPLTALMVGGTVFGTIFYVLASAFNAAGLTRLTALMVGTAVVFSIIANAAFLPVYGVAAAAIIFSLNSTLLGGVALLAARRIFGAKLPCQTVLRVLLSAGIIYLIVQLVPATTVNMLVFGTVLYALYLLILIVSGELTKNDLKRLKPKRQTKFRKTSKHNN